MKPHISCNIEILSVPEETAWILSIPAGSAQDFHNVSVTIAVLPPDD